MSPLTAWANFYVIVGSSAGALTGLTFVAITLMREIQDRGASQAVGAFTTPTVVHFGTVLFIAAILSAPWPVLLPPGAILALTGLSGVVYTAIVLRRLLRQQTYEPVTEDWLWYAICPGVAYVALMVAAVLLPMRADPALFALAAVMLLLVFLGIHNAWDGVTYLAIERSAHEQERSERKG